MDIKRVCEQVCDGGQCVSVVWFAVVLLLPPVCLCAVAGELLQMHAHAGLLACVRACMYDYCLCVCTAHSTEPAMLT